MAITLNHTIVPSKDKVAAAQFFAKIFDLSYEGPNGHFAPGEVNDTFTMDFNTRDVLDHNHYAFHVTDQEFDAVFSRIKTANITYASGPRPLDDMQLNAHQGGRGFYFKDLDGHVLELLTYT